MLTDRQRGLILALLGLCFFLLFLDNRNFWESHQESRRVVPALEILRHGDWLVPTLNGDPFITKPPLYYWILAATFTAAGGFSEWLARMPSAFAAAVSLWCIHGMALRLWNRRTALLAVVVCATSALFYHQARIAELDMLLTAAVCAALYGMTSYMQAPTPRYGLLIAVAVCAVTLTKGPAGLVFPIAALAGIFLHRRDGTRPPAALWGWLAAGILLAVPWPAAVLLREDSTLQIFRHEIVNNFTTTGYSRQPAYYYLGSLCLTAPWVVFLPGALAHAWQRFTRQELLIWYWAIGSLVLFSVSGQKKHYYLLPAFPALALLIASWLDAQWDRFQNRAVALPLSALIGVVCLIALALPWFSAVTEIPVMQSLALSVPLFGIVVWIFVSGRKSSTHTVTGIAAVFAILALFIATVVMPRWNDLRSHQAFFERIAGQTKGRELIFYKMHTFEGNFYLNRDIPKLLEQQDLQEYARHAGKYILCHPAMEQEVQSVGPVVIIDRDVRLSTRPPHEPKGLILFRTRPPLQE